MESNPASVTNSRFYKLTQAFQDTIEDSVTPSHTYEAFVELFPDLPEPYQQAIYELYTLSDFEEHCLSSHLCDQLLALDHLCDQAMQGAPTTELPPPIAAANAAKLAAIKQQHLSLQEQLHKEQAAHAELERQHKALEGDVHARAAQLHAMLAKHADMVQPVTQWTQMPLVD